MMSKSSEDLKEKLKQEILNMSCVSFNQTKEFINDFITITEKDLKDIIDFTAEDQENGTNLEKITIEIINTLDKIGCSFDQNTYNIKDCDQDKNVASSPPKNVSLPQLQTQENTQGEISLMSIANATDKDSKKDKSSFRKNMLPSKVDIGSRSVLPFNSKKFTKGGDSTAKDSNTNSIGFYEYTESNFNTNCHRTCHIPKK